MRKIQLSSFWAFTLVELIVVITIIGIISVSTYLPYAHHQKKVLLKQAAREITQSLRDARSLAINGLDTWSWNVNVALYLEANSRDVLYYSYPHDETLLLSDLSSRVAYKRKILPLWTAINSITTHSWVLFTFSAVTGSGLYDPVLSWSGEVDIILSYNGSSSPTLQKNIIYYTNSYISDY